MPNGHYNWNELTREEKERILAAWRADAKSAFADWFELNMFRKEHFLTQDPLMRPDVLSQVLVRAARRERRRACWQAFWQRLFRGHSHYAPGGRVRPPRPFPRPAQAPPPPRAPAG